LPAPTVPRCSVMRRWSASPRPAACTRTSPAARLWATSMAPSLAVRVQPRQPRVLGLIPGPAGQ
jgi:hypothetical protein